jgi:hypothetical protein
LELPQDLATALLQLLHKDPSKRCTLKDLASNNWVTRDGREPLSLTSKDDKEGLNATGFEITNALSFARVVRLKTKVRRLVGNVRKNKTSTEEKAPPTTPTTLIRRSGTKKMTPNASASVANSSPFTVSKSISSYRSTKRKKNAEQEERSSTSSSDDDLDDEDIMVVEDGEDLDSHLIPRRARRRYSKVIPGRVDLTGIITMKRECVNLQLRLVSGSVSNINGREHMEDRHVSIASCNLAMNFPVSTSPLAYFGIYDGHSGGECADFLCEHLHQHILQHPLELMKEPRAVLTDAYEATDKKWLENTRNSGSTNYSGSTAVSVLLWGTKIVVASCGE